MKNFTDTQFSGPLSIQNILTHYREEKITPIKLLTQLRAQALEQSDYNAWITLLDEDELVQYCDALQSEPIDKLPLYGIPFAIKDNIDLAKLPTTAGCEAFKYQPDESAYVVEQLINAGAIPLGKTNLDQFATGLVGTRSPYGEGKNTFNKEYISGGSSAGSAIATALGQVCFALGTDTAGSGRVPAVLNNIIGHKPTKGLNSCTGVVPACQSLDCVSIFALTAKDVAAILNVTATYDSQDCFARKNTHTNSVRYFQRKSEFTFAVPSHLDFHKNPQTQALYDQSVKVLEELGGTAQFVDFSPFVQAAKLLYEGPWVAERWLATLATNKVGMEDLLPEIKTIIGNANNAKASDAFASSYKLAELKKRCDEILETVDFLLVPTTPTLFSREDIARDAIKNNSILGTYTNFLNLLDYTGTAVPIGFTESGVPWGVTLVSQAFSDYEVLAYSDALQSHLALPLGATTQPFSSAGTPSYLPSVTLSHPRMLSVVVCGAHLSGQPLNWQLVDRGATLGQSTRTANGYCLYVLPDGKRPALVRSEHGTNIEVEVWSVPQENYGAFVEAIPAPLGIGKVELEDGSWVSGFICDGYALADKDALNNITSLGGWRAWVNKS